MIKYCSFVDVLALPQFIGKTERDLLHPEMDSVILDLLYPVGVDKEQPIVIQACRHRSNTKGVITNYRYVFNERRDKNWMYSGKSSLEARINNTKDVTLIGELSVLADLYRQSKDNVLEICEAMKAVALTKAKKNIIVATDFESDMDKVVEEIKALQYIQEYVRMRPLSADEDVLWDIKSSSEVAKIDALSV